MPNLSKKFERCIFKEMPQFFESTLSNQQCGFCKGLSTQKCLLVLLEKWNRSVDRGRILVHYQQTYQRHLVVLTMSLEAVSRRCSVKKGVLRNFAKFAGKYLYSCEFCEISKNTFSYRTPPVAVKKLWAADR